MVEILAELVPVLANLAAKLLGRRKNDATRERLADLIDKVGACVTAIAIGVRDGVHPLKECAELEVYIQNLEGFVAEEVNAEFAAQLTRRLRYVEEVPGFAHRDLERELASRSRPRRWDSQRFARFEAISEVAGTLTAIANLVRV